MAPNSLKLATMFTAIRFVNNKGKGQRSSTLYNCKYLGSKKSLYYDTRDS